MKSRCRSSPVAGACPGAGFGGRLGAAFDGAPARKAGLPPAFGREVEVEVDVEFTVEVDVDVEVEVEVELAVAVAVAAKASGGAASEPAGTRLAGGDALMLKD